MSDPLRWVEGERQARRALGLERKLAPGAGRSLVNFGSNDYLGLAGDPRVVEAACDAARKWGWGAGASPLVTGWTEAHEALARDLAAFEQAEAAAVFPTGFAANAGTIASVVGPGDVLYSDRLNHACLIDGARLSRATVRVYPHRDVSYLEQMIDRERNEFRRALIATDGVFSMDGDLAPLAELAELAGRFDAMLLVDEAHGTGVFGPDGRGASSELGVADLVTIRVGTLSKALGSIGGFVAGSSGLIEHLINRARTLIFSTALPPAAAAAASAALAILRSEPDRRTRVRQLAESLRRDLTAQGWSVSPSSGPIVPVVVGDPRRTVALAQQLREAGMFVPAIRPPTVPEGTSRLRISVTANHGEQDVRALADLLAKLA